MVARDEVCRAGVLFAKGGALADLGRVMPSRSTRQDADRPAPGGDRFGRLQRLDPVPCLAAVWPLSSQFRDPIATRSSPASQGCRWRSSHPLRPRTGHGVRARVEGHRASGSGRTVMTLEGVSSCGSRGRFGRIGVRTAKTPLFGRVDGKLGRDESGSPTRSKNYAQTLQGVARAGLKIRL